MNFVKSLFVGCFLFLYMGASQAQVANPPLNESSLTIYMYPPSRPLNWESPGKLLYSFLFSEMDKAIINSFIAKLINNDKDIQFESDFGQPGILSTKYFSSMGHTIGRVHCTLPGGKLYDKWASFSGQNFTSVDKKNLLKDKIGLGVMFYDYNDGHIINGVENRIRISNYRNVKGLKPHYIRYLLGEGKVSQKKCAELKKMVSFFESFNYPEGTTIEQLNARGEMNNLHFNTMDPYDTYKRRMSDIENKVPPSHLVGGGCAPFGAALVKAAGYYEPFHEIYWKRPVFISEALIGNADPKKGEVREVGVERLLSPDLLPDLSGLFDLFPGDFLTKIFNLSLAKYWNYADKGFKSRELKLYDPAKIWNIVNRDLECLTKYESSRCILFDRYTKSESVKKSVRLGPIETFKEEQSGESNEVAGIIVSAP